MAVNDDEKKKTDLQRWFQRLPFLAGRSMREDVTPTMDATQAWPLDPLFELITQTSTAGTHERTLVEPDNGKHVIVDVANFTTNSPAVGQSSVLFLKAKNTPLQPIPLQTVQLVPGRTIVPLVGGFVVGADGLALRGVRRVYVPAGYMLMHAYTAAIGTETLTYELLTYVFPETQPVQVFL